MPDVWYGNSSQDIEKREGVAYDSGTGAPLSACIRDVFLVPVLLRVPYWG